MLLTKAILSLRIATHNKDFIFFTFLNILKFDSVLLRYISPEPACFEKYSIFSVVFNFEEICLPPLLQEIANSTMVSLCSRSQYTQCSYRNNFLDLKAGLVSI